MKGIASTIVIFVLAAIIFVVALWFLLSKVFPNILYQLEKLLGIVKPTPIESAIICSIARCKYGCNSFRVRDISWVDYDDSGRKINVNCWEKFCSGTSPDVYSDGDKICEKMPVSINLKSSQRISIDHLYDATEGGPTDILVGIGVNLDPNWFFNSIINGIKGIIDSLTHLSETRYTLALLGDYIVAYGDSVDCSAPLTSINFGIPHTPIGVQISYVCYKSVEIKEGKYSIQTSSFYKFGVPLGPKWYVTTIESV